MNPLAIFATKTVLQALFTGLISFAVLKILGIQKPTGEPNVFGSIYALADHPAAMLPAAIPAPPSPAAPSAPGTAPAAPPVKQIVADAVRNPWALFGIGVVLFAAPLTIAQLRAAGYDAAGATRSVYNETTGGYRRIENADDYTGNLAKRRRK